MENNLNDILKNFKKKHKLTQPEMAAILGISPRMYQLYEAGSYIGADK